MSLSITKTYLANSEEWDKIWQKCNYSTYFHSREWAEIWNTYTQGEFRPNPLIILFSDQKRALIPLSYKLGNQKFIKKYSSSPDGTFGGWISADELTIDHAILLVKFLDKNFWGKLSWRVNPYNELASKAVAISCVSEQEEDTTHAINLEVGFETISKTWKKGGNSMARKVRKAIKEGVSVTTASTLDQWWEYYQVYQDSLRRWGDNSLGSYSWELFKTIFQLKSPNVKLWLAYYQDQIISGALCFYAKKHVVYWHGSSLEKYLNLRPVNLVMYEIVKDSCEQGYSWFDFNPSGGLPGVIAFKKSFGAEPLNCYMIYVDHKLRRMVKPLKPLKKILMPYYPRAN
ncbi:MAG: GNAT family N-acetyltransferase [Moorea sp. SIOASIH]|uniref:lipid II:glycine glycyltransferase FemX n=1 Tax=Moorena sp. SIOASIH TaxID=2607817 RepID=UPI0013B9C73A|nr:GNAT family N-acetyltransferase [Moorena sp. SIOASIH]NEO39515.1 GNAT family N-acetyltransferase [Moorena sp. SIOASIH]